MKICENFSGNSLKEDLSIDTTFEPSYFSWDSPFKVKTHSSTSFCLKIKGWYPGIFKNSGNLIFQHSWIAMSSTLIHLFVNSVINSYKLSNLLLRLWTFKLRYTGLFRIWSIFKNDLASWNLPSMRIFRYELSKLALL